MQIYSVMLIRISVGCVKLQSMPLSGAERNRLYRERLQKKLGDREVKAKDASRKAASRLVNIEQSREKEKERQQRCRAKKREAKKHGSNQQDDVTFPAAPSTASTPLAASESPAYKSSSSFGKAVKRAQTGLPRSPRKRQKVVQKLVVKFLPPNKPNTEQKQAIVEPHNKLSGQDKHTVVAFYMRSDISWTAPGSKDYVLVKRDGKKLKLQKQFMMMSLTEAHQLFSSENPSIKIGRSKFSKLRPDTVMLAADMPHNLCVCKYDANIDLLLQCLSCATSLPRSHKELFSAIVCDVATEECMLSQCDRCKVKTDVEFLSQDITDTVQQHHVKWFQWDRSESGQSIKVAFEGTVHDALSQLCDQLVAFKRHVYVKNKQAAYFRTAHQEPKVDQAVVQVDFSENASIRVSQGNCDIGVIVTPAK